MSHSNALGSKFDLDVMVILGSFEQTGKAPHPKCYIPNLKVTGQVPISLAEDYPLLYRTTRRILFGQFPPYCALPEYIVFVDLAAIESKTALFMWGRTSPGLPYHSNSPRAYLY